jgi:hypothetical protein
VIDRDPANNLELQPGDEITLYTTAELPVPSAKQSRMVVVSGEVAAPGIYEVRPGETLPDLVRRVGGVTRDAYVFGTEFTRVRTRVEQRRNLDTLLQSLESELLGQASYVAQNAGGADGKDLAGQFQMQMQFQRQTIDRLRGLQVTGRVALDLDANVAVQELRSIALEDGDAIHIPSVPDFVSVFGAVDIRSSMIHRPGWRVRDYLERAGPRQFADLGGVVLLRADGTAQTARTSRGPFGWVGGILDIVVLPGDALLVPEQLDRRSVYTRVMAAAKDWTQLLYQFGLGAAAFKVLQD